MYIETTTTIMDTLVQVDGNIVVGRGIQIR